MSSLDKKCNDPFSEIFLDSDVIKNLEAKLIQNNKPRASYLTVACLACRRKATKFYCGSCVTNRNFKRSNSSISFSQVHKKHLIVQNRVSELEKSNGYFEEKTKEQRLKDQITKIKDFNIGGRKKLEQSKVERTELNKSLEEKNVALKIQRKKLELFESRLGQFLKMVENKEKSSERKQRDLEPMEKKLKLHVKYHITKVCDLLPITLFSPDSTENNDCNNVVNVAKLLTSIENRAFFSYINGEFVFTHQKKFKLMMGKVFEQFLPADGNYKEFYLKNKDKKDNYNILIGLSYLVQFVNLVAFYADVILPRPMEFSAFSNCVDFSSPEFQKPLYNMNANIFHLCLGQGVPAKCLHPYRAIPNLIALMYHPSVKLGRFNPKTDLDDSANEYLAEIKVPDFVDSDDDEGNDSLNDEKWEMIYDCES